MAGPCGGWCRSRAHYLAQGGPLSDFVASGWRCDQLGVWDDAEGVGSAWVIAFDSPDLATRAAELAGSTLDRLEPPAKAGTAPRHAVFVAADRILVLRHVAPRGQAAIEASFRGAPDPRAP